MTTFFAIVLAGVFLFSIVAVLSSMTERFEEDRRWGVGFWLVIALASVGLAYLLL